MPFPVSNLPSAAPTLPCDPAASAILAAGAGAPSTETFDTVLVSKGLPGTQPSPAETKTEANPPRTTNSAGRALGGKVPGTPATQVEQTACESETAAADAASESPADATLRYQLVAGQWLVEPTPAPLPTDAAENTADGTSTAVLQDTNTSAPLISATPQQRMRAPSLPPEATSATSFAAQNTPSSEGTPSVPSALQELLPSATRVFTQTPASVAPAMRATEQATVASGQAPAAGVAVKTPQPLVSDPDFTNTSATAAVSTKSASTSEPGVALPAASPATLMAAQPTSEKSEPTAASRSGSEEPASARLASGETNGARTHSPAGSNSLPANLAEQGTLQAAAQPSGGYPPVERKDYRPLVSTSKGLVKQAPAVGTTAANQENTMATAAASSSTFAASAAQSGVAAHRESEAATQNGALTALSESAATHAPKLVHEIREISERVSSIDRNTVEVKFDFNEQDHLSVRVEYRDGTVHTTFRTDSPELRDAIGREWVTQAATENRSFRAADPVFSSSTSGQQNLSSRDGQDNRQQAFAQATPTFIPGAALRSGTGSEAPASATVSAVRRPETSVHLHTFA